MGRGYEETRLVVLEFEEPDALGLVHDDLAVLG